MSVQELSIIGKEPPQNYFHKGSDAGILDASVPLIQIPVVDIGLLASHQPGHMSSINFDQLSALGLLSGKKSWNDSTFVFGPNAPSYQAIFLITNEEKQKYSREADSIEGYGNDMIMSNGIFKSPVHRVVTNSEKERITVAVFCIPDSDKEIKPADALVNETRPRLYKNVKDYKSML
ncbi:hypothetical protein GH714_041474 [Hevea brasiliensis]|uniref:Isopenicillin N synthase-like Fe(2+) 2OG dioxygenase domain-containing protein n=1 Tax=Hevea brasiliensis TaxID=3981 RepID=A0A6A6N106_HEVBR|nr:hypothetical protein GH714_041474 [Hevea brasiliensis]